MAQPDKAVTLEDVLKLVQRLSAVDKVRLIERVAPDVERDLVALSEGESRSVLGFLKDLGAAPSSLEIDAARRDAWAAFPHDAV